MIVLETNNEETEASLVVKFGRGTLQLSTGQVSYQPEANAEPIRFPLIGIDVRDEPCEVGQILPLSEKNGRPPIILVFENEAGLDALASAIEHVRRVSFRKEEPIVDELRGAEAIEVLEAMAECSNH